MTGLPTSGLRLAPNCITLRDLSAAELAAKTKTAFVLARGRHGTCSVTPIQCTEKSQVFRIDTANESFVLKLHASEDAYAAELGCYRRLALLGVTPTLRWHQDRARCIVVDWVAGEALAASDDAIVSAAYWLGALHGALQRRAGKGPTIEHVVAAFDRDLGRDLGRDLLAAFGPRYRVSAVGDVKPEHLVIRQEHGIWVDLETFTEGVLGFHDVLMLANFSRKAITCEIAIAESYIRGHDRFHRLDVEPLAFANMLDRFSQETLGKPLREAWSMP